MHYLDSTLCTGLDQLVTKVLYLPSCTFTTLVYLYLSNCIFQVPALTSPTPALYSSTREAAVSYLTLATTYLASFTLAQIVLKVGSTAFFCCTSALSLSSTPFPPLAQPPAGL